jgi:hypothetical protein
MLLGPFFTHRDTFEVEDDSEDDTDSQNEEDISNGERAITPDCTFSISHKIMLANLI